ncbi:MAG: barstar family protein, partial [Aggregatilineales bacterium]
MYLLPQDNYHYFYLKQLFRNKRWVYAHLDGSEIERKHEFLEAMARGLKFPKDWDWDWDGFHTIMHELAWYEGGDQPGFILHYDRFHRYAYTDWDSFINAYEVLWEAVFHWRKTETPIYVLLQGDEDALPTNFPAPRRLDKPEEDA